MPEYRCPCGTLMVVKKVGLHCPSCNLATAIAWLDRVTKQVTK